MYRLLTFYLGILINTLLSPTGCLGQPISAHFMGLRPYIGAVTLKKDTYSQDLQLVEDNPCICKVFRSEPDKGSQETWTLNLADIHPPSVKFDTKHDAVFMEAATRGKKDLIRKEEDREVSTYEDELLIYAKDLEAAKAMKAQFQEWAKACGAYMEKQTPPVDPENPQEALRYLGENIGEVVLNGVHYPQRFSHGLPGTSMFEYEVTNAKGKVHIYSGNLSDLDLNRVEFETSKERVLLEVQTKQGKNFIRHVEDGTLEKYTDRFSILAPDIETARRWVWGFRAVASWDFDNGNARFAEVDLPTILERLAEKIGDVSINEEQYAQLFMQDPKSLTGVQLEVGEVHRGTEEMLRWNLADLDPGKVEFDTYGQEVRVELKTRGGEDLVQVLEEDIPVDYVGEVEIQAASIEDAREWVLLFKRGIALSMDHYRDPFDASFARPDFEQALQFCKSHIQDVNLEKESFRQSLEEDDDEESCLLSFFLEDVSKNDEYVFRFHLEDLDPGKVKLVTKRDNLFVSLETRSKEDRFEFSKNGEVEDFEDFIAIRCTDLERAKGLTTAFKFLIQSCQ